MLKKLKPVFVCGIFLLSGIKQTQCCQNRSPRLKHEQEPPAKRVRRSGREKFSTKKYIDFIQIDGEEDSEYSPNDDEYQPKQNPYERYTNTSPTSPESDVSTPRHECPSIFEAQENSETTPFSTTNTTLNSLEITALVAGELFKFRSKHGLEIAPHAESIRIAHLSITTNNLDLVETMTGRYAIEHVVSSLPCDSNSIHETAGLIAALLNTKPEERPTDLKKLEHLRKELSCPFFTDFLRVRKLLQLEDNYQYQPMFTQKREGLS